MKTAETKTFTAWTINTNYIDIDGKKYPGFIGRYWGFEKIEHIPEKLEGCRVALFKTREIARKNLQWVKSSFPKAKVKKVHVTIEEIK